MKVPDESVESVGLRLDLQRSLEFPHIVRGGVDGMVDAGVNVGEAYC